MANTRRPQGQVAIILRFPRKICWRCEESVADSSGMCRECVQEICSLCAVCARGGAVYAGVCMKCCQGIARHVAGGVKQTRHE
jgi:hypothetical protein